MNRTVLEEAILPPIVALLLAAVVGDVLILSFGQSPGAVYNAEAPRKKQTTPPTASNP